MANLSMNKVVKRFGDTETIHGIDLAIEHKDFVVFVGPSGCGKTTLLRLIAGLETITDGDLYIGDERANNLDSADRGVAMVFQSYALYPHMTVAQNMGFGLKMAGTPKAKVRERVDDAARILQLENLLDRKPKQLSGGQRQRVAIGRAIGRQPKVFLFDEPLSNLDAERTAAQHVRGRIYRLAEDEFHHGAYPGSERATHDACSCRFPLPPAAIVRASLGWRITSRPQRDRARRHNGARGDNRVVHRVRRRRANHGLDPAPHNRTKT